MATTHHDTTKTAETLALSIVKRYLLDSPANRVYHSIVVELVTDIVTVLCLPEWPAAALLARILTQALLPVARKQLEVSDVSVQVLAVDLLGTLGSTMQSVVVSSQKDQLVIPERRHDVSLSAKPTDEGEDALCICGKGAADTFMLDCDDCHRWFHGSCVGVSPSAVGELQCEPLPSTNSDAECVWGLVLRLLPHQKACGGPAVQGQAAR